MLHDSRSLSYSSPQISLREMKISIFVFGNDFGGVLRFFSSQVAGCLHFKQHVWTRFSALILRFVIVTGQLCFDAWPKVIDKTRWKKKLGGKMWESWFYWRLTMLIQPTGDFQGRRGSAKFEIRPKWPSDEVCCDWHRWVHIVGVFHHLGAAGSSSILRLW